MNLKLILFTLLVLSSNTFKLGIKINQPEPPDPPRLLSFLGKGYNLISGNPYTDKIDEGFRTTVFDFAYSKKLTTDDGKYLIPDFTYSSLGKSCSLEAKTSSFSGTESYQK